MKVVISPDSFKGSLTARQASETIERACREILPEARIVLKPMADGGEGTLDTLIFNSNGRKAKYEVIGPLGSQINALLGIMGDAATAVIETASIAGLTLVPEQKRNPLHTTSYGLGEMIRHALDQGFKQIIIGLGGSATNDGGLGMLKALGVRFLNKQGNEVDHFGKDLLHIEEANFSGVDPRIYHTNLLIASDVDNPLCGPRGASFVYGPQKGASIQQMIQLDQALNQYGNLIEKKLGKRFKDRPGAGAAGGLGFAFMAIGGNMVSGAKLVADHIQLEQEIRNADLLITGEGQSDKQTLYGKVPGYVGEIARKHRVMPILISGSIKEDIEDLRERFAGCFSITTGPLSLEYCLEHGETLLYQQTKNVINFFKHIYDQKYK